MNASDPIKTIKKFLQGGAVHICQLDQLVAHVDHVHQSRAEEIVLFLGARTVLHRGIQICKVPTEIIQNLAGKCDQNVVIIKPNQ